MNTSSCRRSIRIGLTKSRSNKSRSSLPSSGHISSGNKPIQGPPQVSWSTAPACPHSPHVSSRPAIQTKPLLRNTLPNFAIEALSLASVSAFRTSSGIAMAFSGSRSSQPSTSPSSTSSPSTSSSPSIMSASISTNTSSSSVSSKSRMAAKSCRKARSLCG